MQRERLPETSEDEGVANTRSNTALSTKTLPHRLRVLFLNVAREATIEYNVHTMLAEHVEAGAVATFYARQTRLAGEGEQYVPSLNSFSYDFGRDMSLSPKPSRFQRAAMMGRQLPVGFAALFLWARMVKPDVVYTAQQDYDVLLGTLLSSLLRVPHIIHIHYPVGPWLGNFAPHIIPRAQRLIAVSEFIRRGAIEAGVAPDCIHTVLNPADLRRFVIPRERRGLRAEFGWAVETPVVVAAGRLDPSKGYEALIDAFACVHAEIPAAKLLICGGSGLFPGYDQTLKSRVAERELSDAVVFAGNRADMPAVFAAADIFCLPTENDACPMVFLEAMAAGVPAVALDSGGVPEMVVHNSTGLLSNVGDVEQLAANLLALLRDPQRAEQLGAAGRARAFQEFRPEQASARWLAVLRQLVPAGAG